VIDIDFSKELCGGTHASHLGAIGLFKITKESSIAAGVRRIEAVTGYYAEQFVRQKEKMIDALCAELKTSEHKLGLSIKHLQEENKSLQKTIKSLKNEQLNIIKEHLLTQVIKKDNCQYLIEKVNLSSSELLPLATLLQKQLHPAIIILGSSSENKCNLLIKMSEELIEKVVSAKDLISQISPFIDGKGGGKPDQAQAGGKKIQGLSEALSKAKSIIEGLC
jgi:alanyl-tRNA synthetase